MVDWPYHHILYLCCPNSMTAHVDDIIKATSDLVIPLHRAIGAIPRKEVTCWHKVKFPEKQQRHSEFSAYFNAARLFFNSSYQDKADSRSQWISGGRYEWSGPYQAKAELYTELQICGWKSALFPEENTSTKHNVLQTLSAACHIRPSGYQSPLNAPLVCFCWEEGREVSSETPFQLCAQSVRWE